MAYNPNIHHRRSIRLKGYDYAQAGLYFITICCERRGNPLWLPFGEITDGKMILNDAGKMIENEWLELTTRFTNIALHEFVVMPNHFHGILQITTKHVGGQPRGIAPTGAQNTTPNNNVGATLVVAQNYNDFNVRNHSDTQNDNGEQNNNGEQNDNRATTRVAPTVDTHNNNGQQNNNGATVENKRATTRVAPTDDMGGDNRATTRVAPTPTNKTVGDMMDAFKSITTVEYINGVKTMGWPRFDGKIWQRNYHEHIIRDEQSYQKISEYIINNPKNWKDDKFYNQ